MLFRSEAAAPSITAATVDGSAAAAVVGGGVMREDGDEDDVEAESPYKLLSRLASCTLSPAVLGRTLLSPRRGMRYSTPGRAAPQAHDDDEPHLPARQPVWFPVGQPISE